MRTKTIFLTILFFIGLNFYNCSNIGLDCNFPPTPNFFDIQDLTINHRDINDGAISVATINYDEYSHFECRFTVEYITTQLKTRSFFSPFNPVYGCEPAQPGTQGSKQESLIDLQIITINEFDENHPAGSTINDLLEIDDFDIEPMLLNEYLDSVTSNIPHEAFKLKLTKRPSADQNYQIRAVLELSTEEVYELESEPITFL